MMQTSVDLKNQCSLQEAECLVLDKEQQKVTMEIGDMRKRIEILSKDKSTLAAKIEELKRENDDLEAFLSKEESFNPDLSIPAPPSNP